MTTRTLTHIAVGPDDTGKRAEPAELHAILDVYLSSEKDPVGSVIATQSRVCITTHEVQVTTEQERREHELLSLVLRLFPEDTDVAQSREDIVKNIGSLQDLVRLNELVHSFRQDGFVAPYTLEAKD